MRIRNQTYWLEKSKGKHRRLREHAERFAAVRVAREEARPEPAAPQKHDIKWFVGDCELMSCGGEAACMPSPDRLRHYCLCPNDAEQPADDFKCPRNPGSAIVKWNVNRIYNGNNNNSIQTGTGNGIQNEMNQYTDSGTEIDHLVCVHEQRRGETGCPLINICTGIGNENDICTGNEGTESRARNGVQNDTEIRMDIEIRTVHSVSKRVKPRAVPITPKPIHNVIPPMTVNVSGANTDVKHVSPPSVGEAISTASNADNDLTTSGSEAVVGISAGASNAGALVAAAAVGGALLLLLTAALIVCYVRRRACIIVGKSQPRVRPGEPLLAERYITNPQYGVCGGGPGQASTLGSNVGSPGVMEDTEEPRVPLLDRTALTFLEEVGEGCFGKVHKGLLRTTNGEQVVAVKVLKESAGRSAEEDFVREVTIMSAFQHPNILALIGVVYKEELGASPWMVFEYMEWGDLAGVLRGSRGSGRPTPTLDEPALLHVALQVARGMHYLAARRFVHRDLAARNCLVGAHLSVKIADFGMSRDVYTCDYYKMGGERPMPVRWMSPESIVYARFTHESDVWSYGVVLWEIYSRGKQPFYGHNNDGATKLILQGIVLVPPEDCPKFACDLMRACWRSDPRDRIGFDEICRKLEAAATSGAGSVTPTRLPRPPPPPQDSEGYLVPAPRPPVDYLATLPDPEPESASSEDEDEDDEYT